MSWNWQHPDWPHFTYDAKALDGLEFQYIHQSGILHATLNLLDDADKTALTVQLISEEAIKTSEIGGQFPNRRSVQSSIRQNFGLQTCNRCIPSAEQGLAEMMVDLYRNFDAPLAHKMLDRWHAMLTSGQHDLDVNGSYRTQDELMQIISGAAHNPIIHFEAPPSTVVRSEMRRFIAWFNDTGPQGKITLPALTRAGIAHIYFHCVHPFEDCNGRIARALAQKALSQDVRHPTLIALSKKIDAEKKTYYRALDQNNKDLEITDWLTTFANTVVSAQNTSQQLIDCLIRKNQSLRASVKLVE